MDAGLDFPLDTEEPSDADLVVMIGDAWGIQEDGASQTVYTAFLVKSSRTRTSSSKESPGGAWGWKSRRALRMSCSSLNSEAPAAVAGQDALEHVLVTWALAYHPRLDPRDGETMRRPGPSALVIDAKSLYDSPNCGHIGGITA